MFKLFETVWFLVKLVVFMEVEFIKEMYGWYLMYTS